MAANAQSTILRFLGSDRAQLLFCRRVFCLKWIFIETLALLQVYRGFKADLQIFSDVSVRNKCKLWWFWP